MFATVPNRDFIFRIFSFGNGRVGSKRASEGRKRAFGTMHMLYGIIRLPTWGYIALTCALVQLMLLGVTLYLHRDQSHGGLQLHPALRHFFRFWLWFCSGTVTREWVAVHCRHHAYGA